MPAARYPLWVRKETPRFRFYHPVQDKVPLLALVLNLIYLQLRVSLIHLSYMLLLLSMETCQTLLMMLLLPLRLLVHLVLLLKNRLLLLPDSRVLKFLLPKPLLEKLMILLALRRNSLRMIILYLMMIYAGSLMNVLIPTLLL